MRNQDPRTRLTQTGKFGWWKMLVLLAALIVGLVMIAKVRGAEPELLPEPLDSIIPERVVRPLDVTRDTPEGVIRPGEDITAALKWACDNAAAKGVRWAIPADDYLLSDEIRLPKIQGFELLGAGIGNPDTKGDLRGVRTVLKYVGDKPIQAMLHLAGTHQRIGNFTLDGQGKARRGLLVDRTGEGLGTGKSIIEPLRLHRFEYGVQNGGHQGDESCDNMRYRKLIGDGCGTIYHNVNAQGMDNVIEYLHNYRDNDIAVEVSGGGHLWVMQSLTTRPSTLLKVNKDAKVGWQNGDYRFSHTKIDGGIDGTVILVDCECHKQAHILFDGGINAAKDCRINLVGATYLHITDFRSHYTSIECKSHPWGTPFVLVEAAMCLNNPADKITGDYVFRMRDCVNDKNRPWPDVTAETERIAAMESELKKLRAAKVTGSLEVEE